MTCIATIAGQSLNTLADRECAANFSANLAALRQKQPALAQSLSIPTDLIWIFARDGSLSAMDAAGQWWANCSLPLLAAESVLKPLAGNGVASCLLSPPHAGLIHAARQRTAEGSPLISIIPDRRTLAVAFCCHDFSKEIATNHLWFVAGDGWAGDLQQLFTDYPGLPTPSRFIRTKLLTDEVADAMIADAQRVFSVVLADRHRQMEFLLAQPLNHDPRRVLLIAGSRFNLWENAAHILADHLQGIAGDSSITIEQFDSDNPASTSPLALATAAARCGVIVAANITRADAPHLASPETPWIAWMTRPNIPPFSAVGGKDTLLLADPAWQPAAINAGWPAEQVAIAAWPSLIAPAPDSTIKPTLAIIADTRRIEIPTAIEDFSSHRVLWETIEAQLRDDPLAVQNLISFLDDHARQLDISPDTVDRRQFIDGLILPAYQQGLARLLLGAGLPLRIHGRDWNEIAEFSKIARGPIDSQSALRSAIASAAAVVYAWPIRHVHPIDAINRPVVEPFGRRRDAFLREARQALTKSRAPHPAHPHQLSTALRRFLSMGIPA